MKIIADENIPCVEQAFASLGEVRLLPGRGMPAAQLRDADVLLVRSVTRVDAALLADSAVRFVGSATIGFDHIDRDYLQQRGIGFATAPGSNATSAAEYVVSALMVLSQQQGFELAGKHVGIIGCGNVGSRVRKKLSALGMHCRVNDPPRQVRGIEDDYCSLAEVVQSDIVTVHVPLEQGGEHPTRHLVNAALLQQLPQGTILINTSRGAVADNHALYQVLVQRPDLSVVLDVWEGEPAINAALLQQVELGTPHIAGYSIDGKLRGTEMIYRAACDYFDQLAAWQVHDALAPAAAHELRLAAGDTAFKTIRKAVLSTYDVRQDDARLRATLALPDTVRALAFDRLRKDYPPRREFAESGVLAGSVDEDIARCLLGLGFGAALTTA